MWGDGKGAVIYRGDGAGDERAGKAERRQMGARSVWALREEAAADGLRRVDRKNGRGGDGAELKDRAFVFVRGLKQLPGFEEELKERVSLEYILNHIEVGSRH